MAPSTSAPSSPKVPLVPGSPPVSAIPMASPNKGPHAGQQRRRGPGRVEGFQWSVPAKANGDSSPYASSVATFFAPHRGGGGRGQRPILKAPVLLAGAVALLFAASMFFIVMRRSHTSSPAQWAALADPTDPSLSSDDDSSAWSTSTSALASKGSSSQDAGIGDLDSDTGSDHDDDSSSSSSFSSSSRLGGASSWKSKSAFRSTSRASSLGQSSGLGSDEDAASEAEDDLGGGSSWSSQKRYAAGSDSVGSFRSSGRMAGSYYNKGRSTDLYPDETAEAEQADSGRIRESGLDAGPRRRRRKRPILGNDDLDEVDPETGLSSLVRKSRKRRASTWDSASADVADDADSFRYKKQSKFSSLDDDSATAGYGWKKSRKGSRRGSYYSKFGDTEEDLGMSGRVSDPFGSSRRSSWQDGQSEDENDGGLGSLSYRKGRKGYGGKKRKWSSSFRASDGNGLVSDDDGAGSLGFGGAGRARGKKYWGGRKGRYGRTFGDDSGDDLSDPGSLHGAGAKRRWGPRAESLGVEDDEEGGTSSFGRSSWRKRKRGGAYGSMYARKGLGAGDTGMDDSDGTTGGTGDAEEDASSLTSTGSGSSFYEKSKNGKKSLWSSKSSGPGDSEDEGDSASSADALADAVSGSSGGTDASSIEPPKKSGGLLGWLFGGAKKDSLLDQDSSTSFSSSTTSAESADPSADEEQTSSAEAEATSVASTWSARRGSLSRKSKYSATQTDLGDDEEHR